MARRSRVFRRMAVRGVVAAQRDAALLAGAQVDPLPADADALFADVLLRLFDVGDGSDVGAGLVGHVCTETALMQRELLHSEVADLADVENGLAAAVDRADGAE